MRGYLLQEISEMGSSVKHMAAGQRRSLRAIQRKIEGMSAAWADIDNSHASRLDELAHSVGELEKELFEYSEDAAD